MFWVYILQNSDGKFYVGHSENLAQRLKSHNDQGSVHGKFTRKNGPWALVWSEEHATRASAMARERHVKKDVEAEPLFAYSIVNCIEL